ncbi:secretory phospholipase A2 receptor-like [Lingula anatina]|uniref:Secretory phospholipase A2 receptor-like n=1 Tax=Lingula anatina TaxID=7574 RepID=A0A1S3KBC4_LINAN|nr:secretory phospholipase A2 receptor-like [Lingula anatina]|eukprot:XP_013419935.1 secretory phospholipase A2 receptor-like [Lingula anatina]
MEHCKNTCNGKLAVVKDNNTQIFLHKLTSSVVWLGGKEVNLTDWMWIDQEATTFTNWSGSQKFPYIGQQPDTNNGFKYQPAVALMRVNNTPETFPWVDREHLQTQDSGVICEADQSTAVCKGSHNFRWIQNNSRWTDIKNDTCVFISIPSERATWFEGHWLCREAGGKLLKIDNDTVQKKVENRLNKNSELQYYWIGLVHSEWRWVDGDTDDPINLMFWRPIMYPPYNRGPACLALEGAASDVTKSWVMKDCSKTLPYICEYPLGATTLSTEGNRPVTSGVPMTSMPTTKIVTLNPTTDYRTITDGPSVTPTSMTDDVNVTSAVSETGTVREGTKVPHTGENTVEPMSPGKSIYKVIKFSDLYHNKTESIIA